MFIITLVLVSFAVISLIFSDNSARQTIGSDLANYMVAIGTAFLAFVTAMSISDTRKSIQSAEASTRATEKSVERMQDSLRPYLDLDIFYQPSGDFIGLFLTIRNVGVGPGTIQLFTGRCDVLTDCYVRPLGHWNFGDVLNKDNWLGNHSLLNSVYGPGESKTVFLGRNTNEFSIIEGEWISSLSVYYKDIYGRVFRTRIIYKICPQEARVIGKETFDTIQLPVNPLSENKIQSFRLPEINPCPIKHNIYYAPLHWIGHLEEVKKRDIPGTDFTMGAPLRILNVSFDRLDNGYPSFELQIYKYKPFYLRRKETEHPNMPRYTLEPNDQKYAEIGLQSFGGERDLDQIKDLYNYITNQLCNIPI